MSGDSGDVEEAISLCNSILDDLEDLPERAEEFKDSVQTTVLDMHDWIDKHNSVTKKQMNALENIQAGVDRWKR